MKKYGLIGYPLGHSFSKGYFTEKFQKEGLSDCEYGNYPIESIDMLPELVAFEAELIGLNVTIPYKQQVFEYLDDVDPQAAEIGAVNTIKIDRSGTSPRLIGYNTDVYGFEQPLIEVLKPNVHKSALILGTGGASKAVAFILKKHGICYTWVSRTPKDANSYSYEDITGDIVAENRIIINCSPVGMHPLEKEAPNLPYCSVGSDHILYDLIYNPQETRFLKKGKEKKATLINGLPMLHIQAEKSWGIWNE